MNNILFRHTPRGTPGRRKLRKLDPGAVERAKRKEVIQSMQSLRKLSDLGKPS